MTIRNVLSSLAPVIALFATVLATPARTVAQALPAGIGPGTYIQAGGTFSTYQIDYGQRYLSGGSAFVDAHLYRRLGAEAEVRLLKLNQDEGVHETTYLVGPRFSILAHHLRPYGKFLVGRAQFYYPFHYATGSYFVIAPGGGVDWHMPRSPITFRLIDVEMQNWPGFSFGSLKPYGISTGIAFTVFHHE
jgi:hypothetical protein